MDGNAETVATALQMPLHCAAGPCKQTQNVASSARRSACLLSPGPPPHTQRPDGGVALRTVRAIFLGRVCFSSRSQPISVRNLFLPRIFSGTASGQFLRPAASRLLLSRFLPQRHRSSHKAPARLGSSGLSLLGAPRKWGQKKEIQNMSYLC